MGWLLSGGGVVRWSVKEGEWSGDSRGDWGCDVRWGG